MVLGILLGLIGACGGREPLFGSEFDLTSGQFTLGDRTVALATSYTQSQPVRYMSWDTQFPRKPVGMESIYSSLSATWSVDNGGSAVINGNTGTGTGDLNQMSFRVYRVNNGGNDYYVGVVDMIYTDGAGHVTWRPNAYLKTGWPEDQIKMWWQVDHVHMVVRNKYGTITWDDTDPYAFVFPAGTALTKVRSPTFTLGMDVDGQYGGCMRDVPDYDPESGIAGTDNGTMRFNIQTAKVSATGIVGVPYNVTFSNPQSNPQCSMQIIHDPAGYDKAQWHTSGF